MRDRIYTVDINTKNYQVAKYKQFDSGMEFNINLLENNIKKDLTGYTAIANFQRPDRKIVYQSCTIEGSIVTTIIENNITEVAGDVVVEFTFYKDNLVVTTFSLKINIAKSIDKNSITEEPKWDFISHTIGLLENAIKSIPPKEELKGDKGDKGDQGEKGDKGDKGEKGDSGGASWDEITNKPSFFPANTIALEDTANIFESGNVEGALSELFQSASNGKKLIATAITGKDVATESTDSFETMANNINKIKQVPQMPGDLEEIWSRAGEVNSIKYIKTDSEGNIISGGRDYATRKTSAQGVEIWKVIHNTGWILSVGVDKENNIYTASRDKTAKKISSNDGSLIWNFTGHTKTIQDICIGNDGNVYTASLEGTAKKISSNGTEVWTHLFTSDSTNKSIGAYAVSTDSNSNLLIAGVYQDSNSVWKNPLKKVKTDGTTLWSYDDTPGSITEMKIKTDSKDNTIGGFSGCILKKISSSGTLIWEFKRFEYNIRSIEIDSNDNILASSVDKTMKKFNENGDLIWDYLNDAEISTITLDSNENIYFGDTNNVIKKIQQNYGILVIKDNPNKTYKITKLDTVRKIAYYN